MCMCGEEKWNRARNFASDLAYNLDLFGNRIHLKVFQFAEDFQHLVYDSEEHERLTEDLFEDPEAFAGMSSDITSVRIYRGLNLGSVA